MQRRVVITGMGAVSPLGNTLAQSWNALLSSPSSPIRNNVGITSLQEALKHQNLTPEQYESELSAISHLPCQVVAPVRNLENPVDSRQTSRFIQMALKACGEAVQQSGLDHWLKLTDDDNTDNNVPEEILRIRGDRVGVAVGVGMASPRESKPISDIAFSSSSSSSSVNKISPHFLPKTMPSLVGGRLSMEFQARGPNFIVSTACASSAHAIGDAQRLIQYGDADIMLAGGTEATIDPLSIAGFARLRALSTKYNDTPSQASRPFDENRDGFVMGEGSAFLVLEEYEHAQARGAPILAELSGYGLTGDANHITSPDPQGHGALRSIQMALDYANVHPSHVDYVNAHATSTPMGDDIEAKVIEMAFCGDDNNNDQKQKQQRERSLLVSSTKSATGHLLGATGALESVFCVMSIVDGKVPATWNLSHNNHMKVGFEHVLENENGNNSFIERDVKVAVNNSFGFGGTNATLVFSAV